MGSGKFDRDAYTSASAHRARTGAKDFGYHDSYERGEVQSIHETLDPMKLKNGIRESRDSDEHPNTVPIITIFDVTGSMGHIPQVLQKKLVKLMDVIIERGGIAHPHILIGAVGDATCDKFPFQVGQFESDNRFDEQLRSLILEGGGGGQHYESYALAYHFAAHHTSIDSFEKRGKKGYMFTIGDESFWPKVSKDEMLNIFNLHSETHETMQELVARVKEKWEVFHLFANDGGYHNNHDIQRDWQTLLGERLVIVDDSSLVCEVIAGLILSMETAQGLSSVMNHLQLASSEDKTVRKAIGGYLGA